MSEGAEGSNTMPSQQFFENIILSAPEGEIREPKHYELPTEFDLSNISEKERPIFEKMLNRARTYLSYPAVVDGFKDHHDRREWRQQEEQKLADKGYGPKVLERLEQVLHQNKISVNTIESWSKGAEVFHVLGYIPDEIALPLQKILREKVSSPDEIDPHKWDRTPAAEKFAVTDQISDIAAKLITHFGAKATAGV